MTRWILLLGLAPATVLAGEPATVASTPLTFDAVPITTVTPKPSIEIVLTRQELRASYDTRLKDAITGQILAKHEGGTEAEAKAQAAKAR